MEWAAERGDVLWRLRASHRSSLLSSSPMNNGRTVPNFRPPTERERGKGRGAVSPKRGMSLGLLTLRLSLDRYAVGSNPSKDTSLLFQSKLGYS